MADLTGPNPDEVNGIDARGASITGKPVLVGARGSNATPSSVSDGQAVDLWADQQGRQNIVQKTPTATLTNVSSSATSVSILAANTARVGAAIYNDSTQVLYLKFGATASTSSFTVKMASGAYYEFPLPVYTGAVDGLWSSANGYARITELT